ncbi:DUF6660 family protein [Chryseobacterium sp. NRRL B-14859]|uniref:DUF6660 family protein n=1 Tax=Chryseobacterium sp. NRRL B-14859 TaxID=1562763 RepID=UPI003393CC37
MNLLRWILAIYFMALSLMPCEDVSRPSDSAGNKKISLSIHGAHSTEKGDVCSPLCACSCCQITVSAFKMDPLLEVPEQIQTYFSKKILFQKNDFAYQVYDPIWQPPKI